MADCGDHSDCSCISNTTGSQSIQELEFSRGIWNAAMDGDERTVTRMLSEGTDPNIQDTSGYSPLHYASRHGHYGVVHKLLIAGADPNPQTPGGVTPLHRAAYSRHGNIVKLLLSNNADPSLKDSDGMTALHKGAEGGDVNIIKLIINNSPSLLNVTNNKGEYPMDLIKDEKIKLEINSLKCDHN
ncbi:PREDICTED: ankyrin repeat domain-containing protein 39-like [Amphimedon queenslandica]|uniref:Uncharacterized protein n=1 Tax=Amphimedon queenslandica TaxID=400682 RepID=A0A1X7TVR5_AMPQE|nr:PREDICTED: ankyrin repeat domain-containing protein 39-like [Amphimedon queenslandica]|eukprot:XP_019857404.1 PREDICTED: ankyrin repeat domain-containing protein 39-like [Amphimedon queenslandica]